ncbi:MAG: hypothetical protein KTR35_04685, partial [Gammaproteobacteria bacterium]|nr:hypothetical protein [Gammaproteobacteria bacterium]
NAPNTEYTAAFLLRSLLPGKAQKQGFGSVKSATLVDDLVYLAARQFTPVCNCPQLCGYITVPLDAHAEVGPESQNKRCIAPSLWLAG